MIQGCHLVTVFWLSSSCLLEHMGSTSCLKTAQRIAIVNHLIELSCPSYEAVHVSERGEMYIKLTSCLCTHSACANIAPWSSKTSFIYLLESLVRCCNSIGSAMLIMSDTEVQYPPVISLGCVSFRAAHRILVATPDRIE